MTILTAKDANYGLDWLIDLARAFGGTAP